MATPKNPPAPYRPIKLTGARQNNLKSIDVEFPPKKLSVVTGVSGSGKSSLAFDTLYAEGQRRYVESLSTYTRQFLEKMPKPDVDAIENIPPSIALEQRNHIVNSRSTVGTQTEVVDFLRLLFAKIGETFCVDCGSKVEKISSDVIFEHALKFFPSKKGAIAAPVIHSHSAPQEKSKKKTKKKKVAKKATKKSPSKKSTLPKTLLKLLREQGFRRVIWRKTAKKSEVLDLDDLESPDFPKLPNDAFSEGTLYTIIDRLKMTKNPDKETRTRLHDSIDQGIAVGAGKVVFYDFDKGTLKEYDCRFACSSCGREHRVPEPQLFSFNSPIGACGNCSGFGHTLDVDENLVVPEPTKTLKNGAFDPFSKPSMAEWQKDLFRFAERHRISIGKRYSDLTSKQKELLWQGDPKDKSFPGVLECFRKLARYKYKIHIRVFIRRYQSQTLCTQCKGARLNLEGLAVQIVNKNISDILEMPIADALKWSKELKVKKRDEEISADIRAQLGRRLHYLDAVGVGYLTNARLAKTLSGGEYQRINLATQLGNGLCGTLYVLDEPSIGLHAADTERLIGVLENLRDQGNSVVVVEHDLDVMRAADYLVELGPYAGRKGGELIAAGNAKEVQKVPGSLTGKYLSGDFYLDKVRTRRPPAQKSLKVTGCRENNLKDLKVEFPLQRFCVVTGVSGSGKSTLVHKTIYPALAKLFDRTGSTKVAALESGRFDHIYGVENLSGVVLLDQKPIGKSSRSNPATYMKAWDEVRRVFANQVLSLRRGYTPQHFSFNVEGGRCPTCKGEGEITLDMHFMAEVTIPCEECSGKRFKKNILDVTYKNKSVYQLLNTTIDDAYDLFRSNTTLIRKLGILRDVGLGYLHVGQSATTLSGGESQRLKIAHALDTHQGERLLYLFDEPTTGLHQEDIKKLLGVVQDLVDSGNSVIMIEHHMDLIAQADWVIDLGPTGGEKGGYLIGVGPPDRLIKNAKSITGQMLKKSGYTFPDAVDTIAERTTLAGLK